MLLRACVLNSQGCAGTSLELEKKMSEGDVVSVWQATNPQFGKYVPSSVAKLAQKMIGNSLVNTDMLSYESKKLQEPPFEVGVTSIAPVLKDRVRPRL